jgi:hypothetical protein
MVRPVISRGIPMRDLKRVRDASVALVLLLACAVRAPADNISSEDSSQTVGIAFDEIARFVPTGTSPPSVGSFREDAAVIATLPPLVVPKQHQLDLTALTVLAKAGDASSAFGTLGAIPGTILEHAAMAAGHVTIRANLADFNKQKELPPARCRWSRRACWGILSPIVNPGDSCCIE